MSSSIIVCNKFQLTSPQGDERIRIVWSTVPENFNSRLRKETNDFEAKIAAYFDLFQFTSPFGDELSTPNAWKRSALNFNSRLRKETNYDDPELEVLLDTFQLTSPQGDEPQYSTCFPRLKIFQLTSP